MSDVIEHIDGEWELDPEDLAYLFFVKGWMYATPTLGYGTPGPDKIEKLFKELTEHVLADGRAGVMATRGRFLAMRHEDTMSVDFYLNVGYAWPHGLRDDAIDFFEEDTDG